MFVNGRFDGRLFFLLVALKRQNIKAFPLHFFLIRHSYRRRPKQRQKQEEQQPQKQHQQQPKRRQFSQTKVPEAPKRETETLQRKAAPSADVRCPRRLDNLEKSSLNKTFTVGATSTNFRQRCSDGTMRSPTPIFRRPRNRSSSIDSEFSEYGPDVVFGILTRRNRTKSRERNKWNFSWRESKSKNNNSSCRASRMDCSTKLPQLEGFCPGRTSCQFQHISRSHFELIKYKRNLNS
uniref:C3H1-type domain-containing protein n=1 Tax=Globodera rostochiensis TaxID=31243 RepID=A0A914GQN5_GLORO